MDTIFSPGNVLVAAVRLQNELSKIIGESEWQKIRPSYVDISTRLAANQNSDRKYDLALNLIELIEQHTNALLLFNNELQQVEFSRTILNELANQMGLSENLKSEYITSLLVSASEYVQLGNQSNRFIIKNEGVSGEAESVKPNNFILKPMELAKLILGIIPLGYEANPLLLGAGILLTLITLKEATTIKFSERETSVFWGIIQARDGNNFADETEIFNCTNNERVKVGLPPLTIGELKDAVNQLEKIKCIELINGRWRLAERFYLKK